MGTALLLSALISGGAGLLGTGISSIFSGIAGRRQREATREANEIMNQQWKENMLFEKQVHRDNKLINGLQTLGGHLKDNVKLRNNLINIWAGRRGGI